MLALGRGCKYRLSLAERSDCTETVINQLLADSYQNPISEWCVKTSSGLPLILHYGELYNYFIIYYNVIIIEIKCTLNVMCLNHPKTTLPPANPPQSVEKLSSTKPVPGAEKAGDHCYKEYIHYVSSYMKPENRYNSIVVRISSGCLGGQGAGIDWKGPRGKFLGE